MRNAYCEKLCMDFKFLVCQKKFFQFHFSMNFMKSSHTQTRPTWIKYFWPLDVQFGTQYSWSLSGPFPKQGSFRHHEWARLTCDAHQKHWNLAENSVVTMTFHSFPSKTAADPGRGGLIPRQRQWRVAPCHTHAETTLSQGKLQSLLQLG